MATSLNYERTMQAGPISSRPVSSISDAIAPGGRLDLPTNTVLWFFLTGILLTPLAYILMAHGSVTSTFMVASVVAACGAVVSFICGSMTWPAEFEERGVSPTVVLNTVLMLTVSGLFFTLGTVVLLHVAPVASFTLLTGAGSAVASLISSICAYGLWDAGANAVS